MLLETPEPLTNMEKKKKQGGEYQRRTGAKFSHSHPSFLSSSQELMLPDRHPALFLLTIVAAATVGTFGTRLANITRPLTTAGEFGQAEVAVHQTLLGLEDAAGKEKFHAQLVSDARAGGDQAAGGLEDVGEVLGANGGRSRWVQAADVGEADLAVAGPRDVVVGEKGGAHCRD